MSGLPCLNNIKIRFSVKQLGTRTRANSYKIQNDIFFRQIARIFRRKSSKVEYSLLVRMTTTFFSKIWLQIIFLAPFTPSDVQTVLWSFLTSKTSLKTEYKSHWSGKGQGLRVANDTITQTRSFFHQDLSHRPSCYIKTESTKISS